MLFEDEIELKLVINEQMRPIQQPMRTAGSPQQGINTIKIYQVYTRTGRPLVPISRESFVPFSILRTELALKTALALFYCLYTIQTYHDRYEYNEDHEPKGGTTKWKGK